MHLTLLMLVLVIFGYLITSFYLGYTKRYSYRDKSPVCGLLTDLLQPGMGLFFDGKITHFCHWEEIQFDSKTVEKSLQLKSTKKTRNIQKELVFQDYLKIIATELDSNQEGAVLKPKDYDDKWSLVFCNLENNFCQKNTLQYKGEIKILLDGNFGFWGETSEGKIIDLELVEKIKIKNRKDVVYI
jgi:hypothetical protein